MDTFAERFEVLMDDKRVRAAGIAVAAIILAVSMGLLMAAKSPSKPIVVGKVLPETTVNAVMLRWMPDARIADLRSFLPAPMAKISGASAQARGTYLSRR